MQVPVGALAEAAPAAWRHYDALVDPKGSHPWREFMSKLLGGAGADDPGGLAEWLWSEQPRANLWRAPIPEMIALARELAARGVVVGVLSNSEGKIAELFDEIGIADPFTAIVDSGRVGFEKPDRRIFDHTLAVLGGGSAVHIGDSWSADIAGALNAGWHGAIWYGRRAEPVDDTRVAIARTAGDVRDALVRFGI